MRRPSYCSYWYTLHKQPRRARTSARIPSGGARGIPGGICSERLSVPAHAALGSDISLFRGESALRADENQRRHLCGSHCAWYHSGKPRLHLCRAPTRHHQLARGAGLSPSAPGIYGTRIALSDAGRLSKVRSPATMKDLAAPRTTGLIRSRPPDRTPA